MPAGRIFVSYRREDTAGYAGRLADRLEEHFPGRVFRDTSDIAPGADFQHVVEQALAESSVFIAVIGRNWLTDAEGRRRLNDADDFVRREIATALSRDLLIIPVLTRGVPIPRAEELPPDVAPLSRRQAVELHDVNFKEDVDRVLVPIIRRKLGARWLSRRQVFVALALLLAGVLSYVGVSLFRVRTVENPTVSARIDEGNIALRNVSVEKGSSLLAYASERGDDVYLDADFQRARLTARTALLTGLTPPREAVRVSYTFRRSEKLSRDSLCRPFMTMEVSGPEGAVDLSLFQRRTPVTLRHLRISLERGSLRVSLKSESEDSAGPDDAGCPKFLQVGDAAPVTIKQAPVSLDVSAPSEFTLTFAPLSDKSPAGNPETPYPTFNFVPPPVVAQVENFRGDLRLQRLELRDESITVLLNGRAEVIR